MVSWTSTTTTTNATTLTCEWNAHIVTLQQQPLHADRRHCFLPFLPSCILFAIPASPVPSRAELPRMAQLLVVSSTSVATPSLAYCNADFSTGRVPALPEGATLRQVHVLIRHGARAPSDNRPAWANDTAKFECNATGLFGHVGAPDRTVLRHGAVLFRKRYVRNRLPGTCATGQLVQPGWQMEHASGTHLKERYSSLLPTTLDGDGQSTFYLRSDDSERTLQSGAALFSGMYPDATAPDGGSATIVPMHIILAAALGGIGDSIMPSTILCPALEGAYRRAAGSAASMERARVTAASLTPHLVAAIGETWLRAAPGRGGPPLPAWSPYIHLLDWLMSHICPTVPSRGDGPPPSFTPQLQQQVIDEAAHEEWALYNDSDVARFSTGPLIGEILERLNAAIARVPGTPKFVLLSGHDTGPILNFLAAFGAGDGKWPPFASLLALELYETGGGLNRHHAIRLVYNGEVVTSRIERCSAYGELCPWPIFRSVAASLVPNASECAGPPPTPSPPSPSPPSPSPSPPPPSLPSAPPSPPSPWPPPTPPTPPLPPPFSPMPTRFAVAGLEEAVEEARRPLIVAIGVLSFWLVVLVMCVLDLWRKGQRVRKVASLQQPLLTADHPWPRHHSER